MPEIGSPLAVAAAAAAAAAAATVLLSARARRKRRSAPGQHGPAAPPIYLDYHGTSPIFPEVTEALHPFTFEHFGNPSSSHAFARPCKAALEVARGRVASLLGVDAGEVVFTSCGSESDNWAVDIALDRFRARRGGDALPVVVTSAVEHVAILSYLRHLEGRGRVRLAVVPVDAEGVVRLDALPGDARAEDVALVTVMHSNNETGAVQPVAAIARTAKARWPHALVHTDAAQSVGKVAVRPRELGADLATVVGHKFGAPKGCAALYIAASVGDVTPFIVGGGQEGGRRAGTENVMLAAALGAAALVAERELDAIAAHMRACRDRLLAGIRAGLRRAGVDVERALRVNGPRDAARRLPNTLSLSVRGLPAARAVAELGDRVALSAGSACHAGASSMSAVLRAMGMDEDFGLGTLRLTCGRHTTAEEIDAAAALLVDKIAELLPAGGAGDGARE